MHNNLGLLHYEQGNYYQAVLAFEQAMDLMPQDPTVLNNLGLTLEAAGKIHEALDLYMQAAEMDPVNPNFLGNLVRLRVRMGDHDPSLVVQLQDLVLIETRPEWRRWADELLALRFNPILDRGPETPEFDLNEDREEAKRDRNVDDQIIDLSSAEPSADCVQRIKCRQSIGQNRATNHPCVRQHSPRHKPIRNRLPDRCRFMMIPRSKRSRQASS